MAWSRPSRLSARARLLASTAPAGSEFVGEGRVLPPRTTRTVTLPHGTPRRTQSCEILRREPANSALDWLFTPRPESEERVARQHPFGRPPSFRTASTCSGLDRTVSGSMSVARCGGTTPTLNGRVRTEAKGTGPIARAVRTAVPSAVLRFLCATAAFMRLKLATT